MQALVPNCSACILDYLASFSQSGGKRGPAVRDTDGSRRTHGFLYWNLTFLGITGLKLFHSERLRLNFYERGVFFNVCNVTPGNCEKEKKRGTV